MNTSMDYWVLQRRLLAHMERLSWWMEEMYRRRWNLHDIVVIDSIHRLGLLYSDQGRLPEVEAMLKRALQGKEKALGPDHTSTLRTVKNLGILYRAQGRLSEAKARINESSAAEKVDKPN